jgi:hypothetical protein
VLVVECGDEVMVVGRDFRVELFAQIRRDARVGGMGIRALARKYEVGRETVRQALRSAEPPTRKTPVRAAPMNTMACSKRANRQALDPSVPPNLREQFQSDRPQSRPSRHRTTTRTTYQWGQITPTTPPRRVTRQGRATPTYQGHPTVTEPLHAG